MRISWEPSHIRKPRALGVQVLEEVALNISGSVHRLDPLFPELGPAWKFPAILRDTLVGAQATELYDDALKILEEVIDLKARAVFGLFPANSSRMTILK